MLNYTYYGPVGENGEQRRVFYVDVGDVPPEPCAATLEAIKNEIQERKIDDR